MAITEINSEIQSLSGVGSASSVFVESAQRWVASSLPKNYMWAYAGKTSNVTSNPLTVPKTDSILAVVRNGHHCAEIEQKYRGMVESNDTASLYFPTAKHPKFTKDANLEYRVYPAPTASPSNPAYILFVDHTLIDDGSELRNAVIYMSISKE